MSSQIDPKSIDLEVRANILAKLRGIETENEARILFAIESGSRAWGFPSPDSDYDARFVYARSVDWYLSISPGRNVIELPIEGDLDINGWDIQKALHLILKPNPVLLEWLTSPIRYQWNDAICDQLIAFSKQIAHNKACVHHYVGLGEGIFARTIEGKEHVSLKKYFYVLRPAMALRWLRMNPCTIPPMNFHELMSGVDLPSNQAVLIQDLLEKKLASREMGEAPRIRQLEEFVLAEFEQAKNQPAQSSKPSQHSVSEANELFRSIIRETV
ncbi:MAG: nucleotidyltransferase domain-containing protein [Rhodobacteraceae bacterium]|nr:nucleotidyltransferase domain-containing protein [Paracoccaceae bacterium]